MEYLWAVKWLLNGSGLHHPLSDSALWADQGINDFIIGWHILLLRSFIDKIERQIVDVKFYLLSRNIFGGRQPHHRSEI